MTVSTTNLLELLAYAGELNLSFFVEKDKDGDYIVKFYEPYTNKFDETLFISYERRNDEWYGVGKGTCSFRHLMDTFVDMLKKKEEKLKSQKRQELLNRLTDEEKELLGVK
jgi:hypothetical protein